MKSKMYRRGRDLTEKCLLAVCVPFTLEVNSKRE